MATFPEQYKELFGKDLEYDPIKDNGAGNIPRPRLALPVGGVGASPTADPTEVLNWKPPPPAPEYGGLGSAFAAGLKDVPAMGYGALEYGARQGVEEVDSPVLREILSDFRDWTTNKRTAWEQSAQESMARLSPDDIMLLEKEIATLDPDSSLFMEGPSAAARGIALRLARIAPPSLTALIGTAALQRAGLRNGAVAFAYGSEAGMSLGAIQNNVANEIGAMDDATLAQNSKVFAQLVDGGMDPIEARNKIIAEAQGAAPLIAGLAVGAISAAAARYMEPIFTKGAGGNIVQRFGRGYAIEAPQEGSQGAMEQLAQNVAAQAYDADRSLGEGVLQAGLEEGALGGIFGGGVAAIAGRGAQPDQPTTASVTPEPVPPRPASFEQVFGPNGERPSAEPFSDIAAQLEEMRVGNREGVYLSADNLQNIDPYQLEQAGVVIPNFDEAGGAVVFRDEGVASLYERQKAQGVPMQTVLGQITGAGRGKPADGDTAVQRMDEAGNVLQESLVPAREAELLQQQWQRQFPNDQVIITTPDQVIGRREQMLQQELPFDQPGAPWLGAGIQQEIQYGPAEEQVAPGTQRSILTRRALPDGQGYTVDELPPANQPVPTNIPGIDEVVEPSDELDIRESAEERDREAASDVLGPSERQARTGDLFTGVTPVVRGRLQAAAERRRARTAREQRGTATTRRRTQGEVTGYEVQTPEGVETFPTYEEADTRADEILNAGGTANVRPVRGPTTEQVRGREIVTREGKQPKGRRRNYAQREEAEETSTAVTEAVRNRIKESRKRVSGFLPLSQLEFDDAGAEVRYDEAFNDLVDANIILASIENEYRGKERPANVVLDYKAATEQKEAAQKKLARIRTVAKPKARSERAAARVAERSPEAAAELTRRREGEKEVEGTDETGFEDVDPADFERFQPDDVDNMHGQTLNELFYKAAYIRAGGKYGATIAYQMPEGATGPSQDSDEIAAKVRSDVEQLAEGSEMVAYEKDRKSVSIDEIIAANNTDAKKRLYIKRLIQSVRRRMHGGKSGASKITSRARRVKMTKEGQQRAERTAYFDTSVLTRETATGTERDESVANKLKRQERARKARSELSKNIDEGNIALKMRDTQYQEVLEEQDEFGNPSKDSFNLRLGAAYYRQIMQYGEALLRSSINTAKALEQMEKVSKFLSEHAKLAPRAFAEKMSNAARAETRESIAQMAEGPRTMTAETLAVIRDPDQRVFTIAESNDKVRRSVSNFIRSSEIYRTNDIYQSAVAPVMEKFANSIINDGFPSYQPTIDELEGVKWALDTWMKWTNRTVKKVEGRESGSFYDEFYRPLKRYFQELGYEFDGNGSLVVQQRSIPDVMSFLPARAKALRQAGGEVVRQTDAVLEKKLKARGYDGKAKTKDLRSAERVYEEFKKYQGKDAREEAEARKDAVADAEQLSRELAVRETEQAAERVARAEIPGRDAQINRIIEQFKSRISNPKMTVEGMIRQEQRLIRAFKELGMWRDTPSPVIGRVVHPTTGVVKNFSIVGPRLEAKKLSKPRARELMLNISPFKLAKPEADIAVEVQERAQKQLNAETEFFYREIGSQKHGDAFLDAAVAVRQKLDAAKTVAMGHDLLDSVIESVPVGHPYHTLATRLRAMNVANIPVRWSAGAGSFALPYKRLGTLVANERGNNYVMMNRQRLNHINATKGAQEASAAQVHVLLHELTHAATLDAVENDLGVRQAFKQMQTIARREFNNRGWPIQYGIDEDVREFVAEAFSNTAFQQQLKEIKYEKGTLWSTLLSFIRQLLGIPLRINTETNLLDVVMATADRVFVDTAYKTPKKASFALEDADPVANTYLKMGDNFFSRATVDKATSKAKWYLPRAPLNLMTLNQIRDTFKGRLNGLDEYYRAFKNRDARNSELLETAERLSRKWTSLTENAPAEAAEFSYLATQATIHGVDPSVPVTHKNNAHLKAQSQKNVHADLRKGFEGLGEGFQKHWNDLQKYYRESVERESKLLTLNALRAVLTKGKNPAVSPERFEKEYTFERMAELDTAAKLTASLGEFLEPEMIATITKMRTVAQMREGPYFPIMRYGEYTVEAEKVHPAKLFKTMKEARAWGNAQLAEDPTLEIVYRANEDGSGTAQVREKVFLLAESPTEAQIKREELVAEGRYDKVSAVTKKLNEIREASIQSNNALQTILNQLEGNSAAQAAIKQYYLRSLADSSFRKHEVRRKNRRGYDSKLQHRNFTNYAQASAYYTAQLEFGWKMADAMQTMYKDVKATEGEGREGVRKSEVYEQLADRDKKASDPMVINKMIRNGVSFAQFTMLTSPSYWMINATQPYMVSLPYMAAKFGMGSSTAALINAQKMIAHPLISQAINTKGGLTALFKGQKSKTEEAFNVVDQVKEQIQRKMQEAGTPERGADIISMLDELRRESILDLSWIAELRDISEGASTGTWQKVLDASRIMSHLTEVNNRILTAIAAYNLASNTMSREEAIEYTKEVVAGTHFDYSSGAKPMLFRPDGPLGAAAPLVFQFMQWPQHMYAMLITNMVKVFKAKGVERKEAAKILGGLLGTHMIAGGVIGTMLQPIKWAIGLALWGLGDDDEPYTFQHAMSGATFDRYVQEGIATLVGPGAAEILSRGVPAGLGTDLSDRMALGTLYFMDLRPETMESTLGSVALSMGGPWLSLGESWGRAMAKLWNAESVEDVARAGEYIAPKVLRDMLKTVRYARQGLVNNRGDLVIDGNGVPPQELFLQAMGFSSGTVSNFYNRQAAIKDMELYGSDRRQSLIDRFGRASDTESRRSVMDEVAAFNKAFPASRITRSSLLRAVQGKKEREASYRRHGANLRGKAVEYADEGWYFQ